MERLSQHHHEPVELPTEAALALQSGRRLEAIRIVREHTDLSHSEARELVERAAREHGPDMPRSVASREDNGWLRLIAALVVLSAIAAAVLWF